jgi:arsenate reductase
MRAAVVDRAGARALLLREPSLVKRPLVEWGDGRVTVGFDAARWQAS